MKWNLQPASLLKSIAASVSVFTMCIAPVAQGAAAASNKQLINQYLKETGISTKKITIGQYWASVRHVYPAKLQKQLDGWVAINKNQMMPKIEATTFKGSDGVEQVRLTMSRDGQAYNITFTGNEDFPVKVNGVALSAKEMLNYNKFDDVANKLVEQDPALKKTYGGGGFSKLILPNKPVMGMAEFKKLSPRQRAEYLIRLRLAMESAEKVLQAGYTKRASVELENKYEYALNAMFGDFAIAKDPSAKPRQGDPCIIAGYISTLGADLSCGSELKGRALNKNLRDQMAKTGVNCGNAGVPCNPLVYGFDGSSAYCVPQSKVRFATRECNSQSKLRKEDNKLFSEDKKRIIESYLKNTGDKKQVDLELNAEGKIKKDQEDIVAPFINGLEDLIAQAKEECQTTSVKDRTDQVVACEELQKRLFSLKSFENRPEPPAPPVPLPNPPTQTCEEVKPGSAKDEKGNCTCEATGNPNMREEGGKCVMIPAVVVVAEDGGNLPQGEAPQKEKDPKEDCRSKGGSFWECNSAWLIPVGLFALGVGLFWWLKDRNKTPPAYVPPAPVPEPSPSPSATPPPVSPPPTAPCPSPNTWVNGVCTPPSVVPPPAINNEGGNKVETPGRVNGVR